MARMFRSLSAGVLAMALVVAGCGDDEGGSSSENLSQGSAQSTTSTTAAGGAAGAECKTEGTATGTAGEEVVLTLNEFTIKACKAAEGRQCEHQGRERRQGKPRDRDRQG